MTTQGAIDLLRRMQEPEPWEPQITEEAFDALEMAIEALKQKNLEEELISRKAALAVFGDIHPLDHNTQVHYNRIKELPIINP